MDSNQSQQDHQSLTRDNERLQSQYTEIAKLAGGLAHEIRNPLSTIALNLDLLLEDLAVGDSPRERRMLSLRLTLLIGPHRGSTHLQQQRQRSAHHYHPRSPIQ